MPHEGIDLSAASQGGDAEAAANAAPSPEKHTPPSMRQMLLAAMKVRAE